jgi:endonuclease/exonuclease/phosphatase family metal-dependent hydrolase
VRRIVDDLVAAGQHVIVCGDLNEGQPAPYQPAANLQALFDPAGPLTSCYTVDGLTLGDRLGTFDTCSLRNRLDYILLSHSLRPAFRSGHVFRMGLWGSRKTRRTTGPPTRR